MPILFSKNQFIMPVLISLLFFQLIYGFLSPAFSLNDSWAPISSYLPKFSIENSDNFLLKKIYPLISSEFRLVSDAGNYLELGRNFNREYLKGHVFSNRPLYPFLIFLASLPLRIFTEPSYGLIFGLAILINFILISSTVILFFWFLKSLFSLKIAWLSSILLIFSPYVRISLVQPLAEMLTALAVVLSIYFLLNYIKRPTIFKLIAYSLIMGVLMLGKMFLAISFFILILAVYYRRFKEAVIFLAVQSVPFFLWYFWVTQVFKIPYYFMEVRDWGMGSWLLGLLKLSWLEVSRILFSSLTNFAKSIIYGFLLIPVIFSFIGFRYLPLKSKKIIYFAPFLSIFLLFFAMNLYSYHHAFLLFPIIYPTCVLGMDKVAGSLKKYRSWLPSVFYFACFFAILFISNMNIGRFLDWFSAFNA